MRDGPIRRLLKLAALACFRINLGTTRWIRRVRGEKPFLLGGACGGCAACCESPMIQVGRIVWFMPTIRRVFLAWHRHVNGFELLDRLPRSRTFVFRCTHWDPKTRLCDSYSSRPGMCRDYPRALLWSPRPEMLPGCGYRPISPDAGKMLSALQQENLTPEQLAKIKKGLNLE